MFDRNTQYDNFLKQAFGQTVQLSDDAKRVTSELGWCGESFYEFQIFYFFRFSHFLLFSKEMP